MRYDCRPECFGDINEDNIRVLEHHIDCPNHPAHAGAAEESVMSGTAVIQYCIGCQQPMGSQTFHFGGRGPYCGLCIVKVERVPGEERVMAEPESIPQPDFAAIASEWTIHQHERAEEIALVTRIADATESLALETRRVADAADTANRLKAIEVRIMAEHWQTAEGLALCNAEIAAACFPSPEAPVVGEEREA